MNRPFSVLRGGVIDVGKHGTAQQLAPALADATSFGRNFRLA
jgi:hypothetical protein